MSKPPPIPPEQRSHPEKTPDDRQSGAKRDRRDATTALQSSQPGDADVNLENQGRQGNIIQNITNQGHQQDR